MKLKEINQAIIEEENAHDKVVDELIKKREDLINGLTTTIKKHFRGLIPTIRHNKHGLYLSYNGNKILSYDYEVKHIHTYHISKRLGETIIKEYEEVYGDPIEEEAPSMTYKILTP